MSDFNVNNKEEALNFLKFIRKHRLCTYAGSRCDCKFGIEEEAYNKFNGEKTGCPEMYGIIHILESLSDTAWEEAKIELNHKIYKMRESALEWLMNKQD